MLNVGKEAKFEYRKRTVAEISAVELPVLEMGKMCSAL